MERRKRIEEKRTYTYHYKQSDSQRIQDYLIQEHRYSSRLLRQVKKNGGIFKNDKPVWATDPLKKGDNLRIILPEEKVDVSPNPGSLDILYEDDEVLIVNKNKNCVTHQTKNHQENTLANHIADYWLKNEEKSKIRFINRLDRDTTGIVVVAKNKYVHHFIQSQMEDTTKTYVAMVEGYPHSETGLIDAPIARLEENSIQRVVSPKGKRALTEYRVMENYDNGSSLLRLRLLTGRTHQLRVHLQYIDCPIIGDPLYNTLGNKAPIDRQALHAETIALTLPKKGRIEVFAPLKSDMITLRKLLIEGDKCE